MVAARGWQQQSRQLTLPMVTAAILADTVLWTATGQDSDKPASQPRLTIMPCVWKLLHSAQAAQTCTP